LGYSAAAKVVLISKLLGSRLTVTIPLISLSFENGDIVLNARLAVAASYKVLSLSAKVEYLRSLSL
jgi:hypothetical protein